MSDCRQLEREIFLAALERKSPEERRAYVREACGTDTELERRVEALLAADDSAGRFFRALPIQPGPPEQTVVLDVAAALQEGPGTVIGRYKLLELIGEGGFGRVYMAEQTEPIRRRVALKILKLGMDTREVIARLELERQALALVDHPNVARILDAGATETGRPFFVMELVVGQPITHHCDEHRLDARERLELFVPVCHAVQHAHQKGIIHRDLKPSNILVTLHDGRPVPKVIDFGIAKAVEQPLTARTLFTRFGRMIGTPAYMSPEQCEMSGLDIDTRSDIYSLGVVLYELLTGRPPLAPERLLQAALPEMQRIIQEEDPPRPSTRVSTLGDESRLVAERRRTDPQRLGRLLCGDLDWIVMKTLEKDRQRRYATASALAEDIERHLRHEPVSAGPPRVSYRFGKFVRRHRRTAVTAALAVGFLFIGFCLAMVGLVKASQERDHARAAESRSEQERQLARLEERKAREGEARARRIAYASDMSLARAAMDSGNLGRTLALLNRHLPASHQEDLRDWEWCYLWKECRSDALATLYRHSNAVYRVAISPDRPEVAVGGFDGGLVILDLEARQVRARLQDSGPPCVVQYCPAGDLLAATDAQGLVRLWRTALPAQSWTLAGPESRLGCLAFSRDGRKLAAIEAAGRLWVWDVSTRAVLASYPAIPVGYMHSGGLAWSESPDRLWIGGLGGQLCVVEALTGQVRRSWRAHEGFVASLALSPDQGQLASGSGYLDSTIRLWEPDREGQVAELGGHRAWISALAYSPDGSWLASASADQTIRCWDARQRRLAATLRGHLHEVWALAFSLDGRTLISGAKDGTVNLWRTSPEAQAPTPLSLPDTMPDPVFTSAAGNALVGLDGKGGLASWDGTSLHATAPSTGSGSKVQTLRGSVARGVLACVTLDRQLSILDSANLRLLSSLPLPEAKAEDVELAFAEDGSSLTIVSGRRQVRVLETRTWQEIAAWQTVKPLLMPIALSRDGAWLASGGDRLRIWRSADGTLLHQCEAHRQPVDDLAFSPDGRLLATASQEGSAKIWEVESWRELAELRGHLLGVHSLAFSPNSRRLVTGSADQEAIKLWDLRTFREVFHLSLPRVYVASVGFSPDGRTLTACGEDGQGFRNYLWVAPSLEETLAPQDAPVAEPGS